MPTKDSDPVQKYEFPSTFDFCLKTPLYQQFQYDPKEFNALVKLECFGGTIDCYCYGCDQHSVLTCEAVEKSIRYGYENHVFGLTFICTRNKSHSTIFIFRAHKGVVEKIGQFPSLGDLAAPDLQKYRPVLTEDRYRELVRGVGLASHDVGIGAFIYLRRVFENQIESAHSKAKIEKGWDESAFERPSNKFSVN